ECRHLIDELRPEAISAKQVWTILPPPDVVLMEAACVPTLRSENASRKRSGIPTCLGVVDIRVHTEFSVVAELVSIWCTSRPCDLIEWRKLNDLAVIHHKVEADI